MSAQELISQIKEDYLTCSICFNSFSKPKALPCLHTFCEGCLGDYVGSRAYQSAGQFPCPICMTATAIPDVGVVGFPDNHLMASLSDTVDKSASKPVPKPRRLLGNPQMSAEYSSVTQTVGVGHNHPETAEASEDDHHHDVRNSCQDSHQYGLPTAEQSSSASVSCNDHVNIAGSSEGMTASSSISPDSSVSQLSTKWQSVPLPEVDDNDPWSSYAHRHDPPPAYYPPVDPVAASLPAYHHLHSTTTQSSPSGSDSEHLYVNLNQLAISGNHPSTETSENSITTPAFYPVLQTQTEPDNAACTENLLLKFGKQGSSVRDFSKPFGLAVSLEGSYIVSDSSGGQNRIFIFNSKGELTTAFNCGCKVRDLTVTKENEILIAVHKNVSAIRHFTMAGICKAEYGKFFTYEEPSGIGCLTNGGVVVSGTQNHCIYVLTDRMKLATKFGRKGSGEGYLQHPGHVTVDSKNHIIVTDKVNNSVQVFTSDGKLRHRFGTAGTNHGQFQAPLGVCVDGSDNIIVADSGNDRVEMFSSKGRWLKSVVINTHVLGDKVKPVNVAVTAAGNVAVLLRGPYFAEVRVYTTKHKHLVQKDGSLDTGASARYSK